MRNKKNKDKSKKNQEIIIRLKAKHLKVFFIVLGLVLFAVLAVSLRGALNVGQPKASSSIDSEKDLPKKPYTKEELQSVLEKELDKTLGPGTIIDEVNFYYTDDKEWLDMSWAEGVEELKGFLENVDNKADRSWIVVMEVYHPGVKPFNVNEEGEEIFSSEWMDLMWAASYLGVEHFPKMPSHFFPSVKYDYNSYGWWKGGLPR